MLDSLRKKWTQGAGNPKTGIVGAPSAGGGVPPRPPPPLAPTRSGSSHGACAAAKPPAAVPSPTGSVTSPMETRFQMYEAALQAKTVSKKMQKLGQLAQNGIPDPLRGVYWRVLLEYMPEDPEQWTEALRQKRDEYRAFCDELIVVPETLRASYQRARSEERRSSAERRRSDAERHRRDTGDGHHGDHSREKAQADAGSASGAARTPGGAAATAVPSDAAAAKAQAGAGTASAAALAPVGSGSEPAADEARDAPASADSAAADAARGSEAAAPDASAPAANGPAPAGAAPEGAQDATHAPAPPADPASDGGCDSETAPAPAGAVPAKAQDAPAPADSASNGAHGSESASGPSPSAPGVPAVPAADGEPGAQPAGQEARPPPAASMPAAQAEAHPNADGKRRQQRSIFEEDTPTAIQPEMEPGMQFLCTAEVKRLEGEHHAQRKADEKTLDRKASSSSPVADGSPIADGSPVGDDPLSISESSEWTQYLRNKQLLNPIDVDIPRTMPSLHFFNFCSEDETDDNPMCAIESHSGTSLTKNHQHLRRLLFIFVRLNPGISYVQGMNELAGHLFYTFAKAPYKDLDHTVNDAEADAFFCFTILISRLGDNFCRSLDRDELGVQGSLNAYMNVFRACDPVLCSHLEANAIQPEFYSFRWLTLLLSQEFIVPDVLRIWDFLFASVNHIVPRLNFTAVAMVMSIRDQLLAGDFSSNLQTLQDYPPLDVNELIQLSFTLLRRHPRFVQQR